MARILGRYKMKFQKNNVIAAALSACLLVGAIPLNGYGATTTKTLSSVTLRVGTDTQAGQCLNETFHFYNGTLEEHNGTYVATDSIRYYVRDAEWVTSQSKRMAIGEEPSMRVYLEIDDGDYAFRGTYSSGSVTVKGGSFVSAKRRSADVLEVVVKLNGIKGTYTTPTDAGWGGSGYGRARWTIDRYDEGTVNSGYYDVTLYRGGTTVKKLEGFKGTEYNFYPYMTKKGTYYYKVRTVPYTEEQKKCGTKSEWIQSEEIYIDESQVSDGSGQTDGNGQTGASTAQVGWIQSGGIWYYRYPDGSYQQDSWLYQGNKWYLFDPDGRMLTGWQTKNGHTYYLLDNGAMLTGWVKAGDGWYYLNQAGDGVEGALHVGWLRNSGKTYYMGENGAMLEGWSQVGDNWYYFYPGYGNMAANATIDTFYVDANGVWRK